jgi:hypothetical protein
MERLNGYRMNLMLVGFVAAIVLGGESVKADFTFGEPTNLGPTINSSVREQTPSISADGLELYFRSTRAGGGFDIWVTTRATTDDPWGTPVSLGPKVNRSPWVWDSCPSISADGLSLFFVSERFGGEGGLDIWVTTRPTKDESWAEPVNLGPTVNSSSGDFSPSISADGLSLYFASGSGDLWVTTRATVSEPWAEPVNLGPTVNSSSDEYCPSISADGLSLFFSSRRSGGYGGGWGDLWITTRPTKDDPWVEPVNLGATVNSSDSEMTPSISADGSTLYFDSNRSGGFGSYDLYQAPIIPIVDFNGDRIVDSADMCIMVDHWGENYSLCDIGPTPLGDGIVDVQDLIVLAEHLFNEYRLLAHWKLDETEGMFAADSAGDNDAFVIGDPLWQPMGGQLDGALEFDGIDDSVITGSVLNPADQVFSVFAWITGGAPGQVVLSQMSGANWLCIDQSEGHLTTEIAGSGSDSGPLWSQTVITDGNWHRIGFVWDGSHRALYVDGVVVAEDAQEDLVGSSNGLYIGTGKAMQSGTYFSGLIDDVRIYNGN